MKTLSRAGPSKTRGSAFPHTSTGAALEHLVEAVLSGSKMWVQGAARMRDLAQRAIDIDVQNTRVVVLGGGTGLSTVVGGNSQMPDWPDHPFVGLKQEFPQLDVVVCTTDDGGSTGRLLRQFPMIGIGDLRKSFVSLVRLTNLQKTYGFTEQQAREFVRLIQQVFNHRFPADTSDFRRLKEPLLCAPAPLRGICPEPLAVSLRALGGYISPGGSGPTIHPAGHCLGNLLLTAAILKASGGRTDRPPTLRETGIGLGYMCRLTGVTPGCLHAATLTPGQLKFRYTNGVEVYGQSKSAHARRGFPVERLVAEFAHEPTVSSAVCRAIRDADLIIYAPGSLYTSILPILQLLPIVQAIRKNHRALKILGVNFWIQEGETDLSMQHEGRGFLVSDLIEAYHRNVPGSDHDLFSIVLSADLKGLPGNILRKYALEGKSPIHLDRAQVEGMGFQPVEATLFSPDFARHTRVIHHDAGRFASAIRALLYAWNRLEGTKKDIRRLLAAGRRGAGQRLHSRRDPTQAARCARNPFPCEYLAFAERALRKKKFAPAALRNVILDLAWENRDIRLPHFDFFDGARVIRAGDWGRSTAWDNVLGYYDPEDRFLKVHEQLLTRPVRLREDLLIALGESLLGRYIESRNWRENGSIKTLGARSYEIRLRPEEERKCFLTDAQLHRYLKLARMVPDQKDRRIYRITINNTEGFLPPGLLFGLLYAWYLNSSYAAMMEYEMSPLRWPLRLLIPHQAKERARKQSLVAFFRTEIFGHSSA